MTVRLPEQVWNVPRGTDRRYDSDEYLAEFQERGRYPAIDLLRSVSRSLPDAASAAENALISDARRTLGAYDRAEMMVQAGLYVPGTDAAVNLEGYVSVTPMRADLTAHDHLPGLAAALQDLAQHDLAQP